MRTVGCKWGSRAVKSREQKESEELEEESNRLK